MTPIRSLAAVLVASLAVASPARAEDVSGQVVAIGQQGRLVLNLTASHLRGGERAQIVRQTTGGGWVRAAVGQIVQVAPNHALLELRRYEPGMTAAVVGDYVVVTKLPPPEPLTAGYPGRGASPEAATAAAAATTPALAAATEPEGPPRGERLSISLGLKGFGAFAGKEVSEQAPKDESGKAGFGWAVGPMIEVLAWRHVAFETGVAFYRNTLKKTTTYDPGGAMEADIKQAIRNDAVRIPLLLKGVLPVTIDEVTELRLSLGGGLALVLGRESELDITIVPSSAYLPAEGGVEPTDQRFLVLHLGFALAVEDVVISLDLRGAYNGENSPEFKDYLPPSVDTEAMEHTVDAGAQIGVSYEFDAL